MFFSDIIKYPSQFCARTLLWCMGWSKVNPSILYLIKKDNYSIWVYGHTSYADFFILSLYLIGYSDDLPFIRTLIKPQLFKYFGNILTSMGAIHSTRLEENGKGAVKRIASNMISYKNSSLLIAPKGTIAKKPWRSGYYWIAKAMEDQGISCPIRAATLDYDKKCVHASEGISCKDKDESEIKSYLMNKLFYSVPLFRDREEYRIRPDIYTGASILSPRCKGMLFATTIACVSYLSTLLF